MTLPRLLRSAFGVLTRCRGCLGPLDPQAEAGLCGPCWAGLLALPEGRCPACAQPHDSASPCPDPVAWDLGDALWNYHGGRPPLGALLVPAIKDGERGWQTALLRRAAEAGLPPWAGAVDAVTAAPSALPRRLLRGFDLGEAAARLVAHRLERPFQRALRKGWWRSRQATRTESERRHLPRKAITLRPGAEVEGLRLLLVDDVWTTGTTLLRCAQALREGGAAEVRVLALFRAL